MIVAEIVIIIVVSLLLMIILAVASLLKIKYRSTASKVEKSVGLDSVMPSPIDGFSILSKTKSPAALLAEQRAQRFIERAKSERNISVPNFRSKPARPILRISNSMYEIGSSTTDEQSLDTPKYNSEVNDLSLNPAVMSIV